MTLSPSCSAGFGAKGLRYRFEQPDIASTAADKFDRHIDKFAFRVERVTVDGGKESSLWHGMNDGNAVTFDTEPYVGPGTKAAVRLFRRLPVDWLL